MSWQQRLESRWHRFIQRPQASLLEYGKRPAAKNPSIRFLELPVDKPTDRTRLVRLDANQYFGSYLTQKDLYVRAK